jgi:hypothetical protein
VEDICAVAGLAVVDEVLPGKEAFHTASDAARRFTRIWLLSEQPETLGALVSYSVCRLQARPSGPKEEDLIQIPLGILWDGSALLARGFPGKELTPPCLHRICKLL